MHRNVLASCWHGCVGTGTLIVAVLSSKTIFNFLNSILADWTSMFLGEEDNTLELASMEQAATTQKLDSGHEGPWTLIRSFLNTPHLI